MGISDYQLTPEKPAFHGSEAHVLLTVFGAAAVAITTFFGADKPLEDAKTPVKEKEHAAVMEKSANTILEEEKRLRFVERRLENARAAFSNKTNIPLKEQFRDMDDEYRQISEAQLRQQQRYADLMQNLLTSPLLSEKEAHEVYRKFGNVVYEEKYLAASKFFFPMKDEIAFRNECLAEAKASSPAAPLPDVTKSVLACARTADARHDLGELAAAGAAGLAFGLSAYHLPLVMSRRRKKPETTIKQVLTIHQKNEP